MIEATSDAQGTRDKHIQYIFQHEQQQAVKKDEIQSKNVEIVRSFSCL